MHPAWVGAGGNWLAIDEVVAPEVVRQQDRLSCGAACGEMLLRDCGMKISQSAIVAQVGVPLTSRGLAYAMNIFDPATPPRWAGGTLSIPGATQAEIFETLNTTGPWAAMLWEVGSEIGHMVVIDGMDESADVLIRDPWEGTKYKMKEEDFLQYWNQYGVYRRR